MYLHRDRETFKDMVEQAADSSGRTPAVVEKDYYVTLILKLLSEQLAECVFKGGTSLSKGFHVIDRFSEDIDITFKEHIGESRRKKLKNVVLKGISEELGMPIFFVKRRLPVRIRKHLLQEVVDLRIGRAGIVQIRQAEPGRDCFGALRLAEQDALVEIGMLVLPIAFVDCHIELYIRSSVLACLWFQVSCNPAC